MNKRLLGLLAVPLVALPLAACGPQSHSDATAASAKATAAAADASLAQQGYTPTHVPGFGKFDLGYSSTSKYHYAAVYSYSGKNGTLVADAVQSAEAKLAGQQGVKLGFDNSEIIVEATTLTNLRTAAKAIASSFG